MRPLYGSAPPPAGPFHGPDTCEGEEKACGLCRNCTMPQADPLVSRPVVESLDMADVRHLVDAASHMADHMDQESFYCEDKDNVRHFAKKIRDVLDGQRAEQPRTNWHRGDCPEIWGYGCNCGGNEPRP